MTVPGSAVISLRPLHLKMLVLILVLGLGLGHLGDGHETSYGGEYPVVVPDNHFNCPWSIAHTSHKRLAEALTFRKQPPKKIETLIIADLEGGSGSMCDSTGWRGQLPYHMVNHLKDAEILVWENARHNDCALCYKCTAKGLKRSESFDCDEWMWKHRRKADALLIAGSGAGDQFKCKGKYRGWWCNEAFGQNSTIPNSLMIQRMPSIYNVVSRPWITSMTWTMHIPVKISDILEQNVFNFSSVLRDSDFVKPPSEEYRDMLKDCASGHKHNTLIYAARYSSSDHKGQEKFLRSVPEGLLNDFTVHFFGSGLSKKIQQGIENTAKDHNITVEVHDHVTQHMLMTKICQSKGSVIFSRSDANPRVAYEGLPAGNPVFVSTQTHLPRVMLDQPFVFYDDFKHGQKDGMPGFRAFMHTIQHAGVQDRQRVADISNEYLLHHDHVYHTVFEKLGLDSAANIFDSENGKSSSETADNNGSIDKKWIHRQKFESIHRHHSDVGSEMKRRRTAMKK